MLQGSGRHAIIMCLSDWPPLIGAGFGGLLGLEEPELLSTIQQHKTFKDYKIVVSRVIVTCKATRLERK